MMSEMTDYDRPLQGLSPEEAVRRLGRGGYNDLPIGRQREWFRIAFDVVREPMFLLLMACGALYLVLGDAEEALLLLGFVCVIIGITFFQERKTERALEALRDLSSPRALVIRGGEKVRIPGREVVPGDVLLLAEGDRVAADGVVISCANLSVDESLLTGEPVPVRKSASAQAAEMGKPGGDDLPFVYSGSLVVQGQGVVTVLRTGFATEIGKIGKALQALGVEDTPLQHQTARLVKIFALSGLLICTVVVAVLGVTQGDWLNGLLAGLTLAMAVLPEEFPLVLTVFLALGAWRISHHRVLTRRIPAVEALGATTALCVDKTGTLTMNRMSVSDLMVDGQVLAITPDGVDLPEAYHTIVEFSLLASPADPFDPMEKAMKELGERTLAGTEHLHAGWRLVREYPLSPELMAMSRVWRSPDGTEMLIAAKGAPEAVADLCHMGAEELARLEQKVELLARKGRRVLGVARARIPETGLPEIQHDFMFEFLGLLGLTDPVRDGVPGAVQECYSAGIRVIMMTGDYPSTAQNVARQIGLKNPDAVITGGDLEGMGDAVLAERIRTVNVFARTVPEQKLRIVQALKRDGEVVAMTGDGVNDAPALRAAHIGIAMGGRGSDVAREAASLVLVNDDFGAIVEAVRMGRRVYGNLRKAMMFIFSVHVPIAGMSLIPVLLKWPLALFPAHVVFLQLIIDPACSIVFEAEVEGPDTMRRPPRRLHEPLFGLQALLPSLIQGVVVLVIVLSVYAWFLRVDGEALARTMGFTTLVLCSLGLILANRSFSRSLMSTLRSPNVPLRWVGGGAILLLGLVLYTPFMNRLFKFSYVGLSDIAVSVAAGGLSVAVFELLKTKTIRRLLFRME